jgi:hypothetical protein
MELFLFYSYFFQRNRENFYYFLLSNYFKFAIKIFFELFLHTDLISYIHILLAFQECMREWALNTKLNMRIHNPIFFETNF